MAHSDFIEEALREIKCDVKELRTDVSAIKIDIAVLNTKQKHEAINTKTTKAWIKNAIVVLAGLIAGGTGGKIVSLFFP